MDDLKQLFHDVILFEIELWDAVDTALRAECDLQLTWFEIMQLLGRRGGCRVQDMAEEFAITVGGVSKVVDRIEGAGYCARRPNPDDRRSSLVELTPAGQRVLEQAMTIFENELRLRIGSVVDGEELQAFAGTLSKLRTAGHRLKANPVPSMRTAR